MNCTNVFHITTRCNLNCEYCYEKRNRDQEGFVHYDSTKEDVYKFVKDISELETNGRSGIVVFGGEPLLNVPLVRYMYDCTHEFPKHSFTLNITTNGIYLSDKTRANELYDYFKEQKKLGTSTSLDISYDFNGQKLRKYVDGSDSTNDVKRAVELTNEYLLMPENTGAFDFRIRNTISCINYNDTLRNTIYTFEKYPAVNRLIHTYAYNDMENSMISFKEFILENRDKLFMIGEKYDKAVCFQTEICSLCKKCDRPKDSTYRYQTPGSNTYTMVQEGKSGEFNMFKKLVKNDYIQNGVNTIEGILNGK